MIYLYGLLQGDEGAAPPSSIDGIQGVGGRVSVVRCGDLSLICEPHDGGTILPRRKLLLAHARVLEAAMHAGTVLPMRFGMICPSLDEFGKVVERSETEITTALDRIRGRIEVGVRVTAPEEAALQATLVETPALVSARDRLAGQGNAAHFAKVDFGRALGEAVAARRAAAQKSLLGDLVPAAAEHILKAPETDFDPLRAEFLVESGRLPAFSDLLEQSVAALGFAGPEACRAQLVGPGPAFHFVDLSLVPSASDVAA